MRLTGVTNLGCEPGSDDTRQQPGQSALSTRQAHPVGTNACSPVGTCDPDIASTEKREADTDGRSVSGGDDHLRNSIQLRGHERVLALPKVGRDVCRGVFRGVDVFPGRTKVETS